MDSLEHMLFNIDIPTGKPEQGAILVSEPFLKDEYFNHSVIAMIEHEERSTSMGVVLNHMIPFELQKVIDGIYRKEKIPVFCGGPMSRDRLFFLHSLGSLIPDSHLIKNGLYFSGDFDIMKEYVNSGMPLEGKIRFFVGYSGWSQGQLLQEIKDNVWAVTSFSDSENLLAGKGDAYWHRFVRQMGEKYRGWLYHPGNIRDN